MAVLPVVALCLAVAAQLVRCDTNVLNDDEVEAVTDLVELLKSDELTNEDYAGNPLDEVLEPHRSINARRRKHLYSKYSYQHVPKDSFSKRAGSDPREDDLPCDNDEIEYTEEHGTSQHGEHAHSHVGSLPGRPGIDFPNYQEIPLTSFTCAGRKTPGFYADVETDCQVFHVCYPHRRESFLCPPGTTFNQPILACDYWYNGNCSASSGFFDPEEIPDVEDEELEEIISTIVDEVAETDAPEIKPPVVTEAPETEAPEIKPIVTVVPVVPEPEVIPPTRRPISQIPVVPVKPPVSVPKIIQFLPVKAKVTKIIVPASVVPAKVKVVEPLPIAKVVAKKVVKAKVVPKAIPVAAVVKAAALPVAKKVIVADKIMTAKAKVALPVLKTKAFKKTAVAKGVSLKKAKIAKAAAVPVISIATKKHLTAALMKMLAAQKMQMLNNAAVAGRMHMY